jgi:hypothetical protein
VVAFADQSAQVNQQEQDIATETAGEVQMTQEAKKFPSTLIAGEEEQSKFKHEVEEEAEYVYDEDLTAE